MDIITLITKVSGPTWNREQRKRAEKEHFKIMDEMLPVIEAYLNSQQSNADYTKHSQSFSRKTERLNKELVFLKVNPNYFVSELSVPDEEYIVEKPNYKYFGYALITIILIIIGMIINSYICDV